MTTEALAAAPDTAALRAAEIAANPDPSPTVVADNPNPAAAVADAPAAGSDPSVDADGGDQAPARVDRRSAIAERFKARRDAESGEPTSIITHTPMGEFVPPFVAKAEAAAADEAAAAAAREEEARKAAAETPGDGEKSYTLKVRGNDYPVTNRAELAKLAELDDEEAAGFSDAALIRIAQKQLAATSFLDEAKEHAKSARQAARATGTTPPDPAAPEPDPDPAARDPQHPEDPFKAVVEQIQFGDPEEGAKALRDLVTTATNEAQSERKLAEDYGAVAKIVDAKAVEFEAANPDIGANPAMAEFFYEKFVVPELRKALVATGKVSPENALKHTGTLQDAIRAYGTAAAAKVNVPTPDVLLNAAADEYRKHFPKPAAPAPTPAPTLPAHDRAALKRALPPQPSSGSSLPPATTVDPSSKGRSIVQAMRARRGQPVRGKAA